MSGWQGKRILITGGSAGFGLQLARTFLQHGATIGIVGRDAERLATAQRQLGDSRAWSADVTDMSQVENLFDDVRQAWAGLDVLVHAVGKSERRLALDATADDFQRMWEQNFLSAVHCVRAALPSLRESHGSLVLIGSLASKIGAANLGGYPPSKFALAAYAQQLRLELRREKCDVHVLLVCPGPIQREDAETRYAEATGVPREALKPGGGARLARLDPVRLAECIVRACSRRQPELILPARVRWLLAISSLCPTLGDWIVSQRTG